MDLKPYFTDLDFWMRGEPPFMEVITKRFDEIESSDDSSHVYHLMSEIFCSFTMLSPLEFRPSFGEDVGREKTDKIMKKYKYYVTGIFVTVPSKDPDLKNVPLNVFLIAHVHAPAALNSTEYLKGAEVYMKEKMTHWLRTADKMVYGVIFVGGRVAIYHMDKATKEFSHVIEGKLETVQIAALPDPGRWKPITDKDVVKSLLGIIQEEWCRIDEADLRKVVGLMKVYPNQREVRTAREQKRREEQRRARQQVPRTRADTGAMLQKWKAEMAYWHSERSSDCSKEKPNKIPRLE